jgi:rare lipoprotein A
MPGGAKPMRMVRLASVLLAATVAGCAGPSSRSTHEPPIPAPASAPAPVIPPPPKDLSEIPAVVPRLEPRSAKGNPPFYDVMGRRYFVLANSDGYLERGVASWYGPGFHAARTSNGESYDMYGLTAAHKTLPLPCYVLVTNLRNGRNVILRVNDRGPFREGRIIDLSYSAAAKLDILRDGTAFVEVRAITPESAATPAPASPSAIFVQAGAFATESNASHLLSQLRSQGMQKSFVRTDTIGGKPMFRVRVGPIPDVAEFDRVVARLKSLGITDARLALD